MRRRPVVAAPARAARRRRPAAHPGRAAGHDHRPVGGQRRRPHTGQDPRPGHLYLHRHPAPRRQHREDHPHPGPARGAPRPGRRARGERLLHGDPGPGSPARRPGRHHRHRTGRRAAAVVRRHRPAAAGPAPRRASLQHPGPDHRTHPPGHPPQPALRAAAPCQSLRRRPSARRRRPHRDRRGRRLAPRPRPHRPRTTRVVAGPGRRTGPARGCRSPPRPASTQRWPSSTSPRRRSPAP